MAPNLAFNLFNIRVAMKKGCNLLGNDNKLTIKKGKFKLSFDQKYDRGDSFLLGVTINP